jgi:hypothetical protein
MSTLSRKPDTMKRSDVVRLIERRTGMNGEYTVKTLFGPDSPARKSLIPGGKHVYVRAVVLEVLGLTDD